MTEAEYYNLNGNKLYVFKLYSASEKFGCLTLDHETNNYYIFMPDQKASKKLPRETGYRVFLSQIESFQEWVQKPTQQVTQIGIDRIVEAKKMIILGAGASYDYTYHNVPSNNRPPLTDSLFDHQSDILKKYAGAYDLSSEILLKKFTLEDYFQRQWEKVERTHDQHLLNKLVNTQYYIHELFSKLSEKYSNCQASNYLNLVKLAHEYTTHHVGEYIPIVTFNYDTLLEEALLRQLQYDYHHIDSYIDYTQHKLLVFKPHGSCNWVRKFNPTFVPANFINQKINSIDLMAKHIYDTNKSLNTIYDHLEKDITLYFKNPNPNVKDQNTFYNNHYPWILIPYKSKDELIMPQAHQTMLKHTLKKVEEILIIGWRGSEDVFQKLLKNSFNGRKLKITLVNPDEKAADNFKTTYYNLLPGATFTTSIENRENYASFSKFIESCHSEQEHFFS